MKIFSTVTRWWRYPLNSYGSSVPVRPLNRWLKPQEEALRLHPKEQLTGASPLDCMNVIKLNSTFFESTDWFHGFRGGMAGYASCFFVLFFWFFAAMLLSTLRLGDWWFFWKVICPMTIPALLFVFWMMKLEILSLTHYPIRFNRRTRKVYVYCTDHTVMKFDWDTAFFTITEAPGFGDGWVCVYKVESDGKTATEGATLGVKGEFNRVPPAQRGRVIEASETLLRHWEFIRRYMEEGPQAVHAGVQYCLPIANKKEKPFSHFKRQRELLKQTEVPMVWVLVIPTLWLIWPMRRLVMATSTIPVWPPEVEAECAIEHNDPYAIEGDDEGMRVAVFPQAAAAKGVHFGAPV